VRLALDAAPRRAAGARGRLVAARGHVAPGAGGERAQ
jgi:hypothetical protein